MHIFPAQYARHSNLVGSQTLTFEIQDENSELIKDIATYPRGTTVLIVVYDIEENKDAPLENLSDGKAASNNFMKRIYAIVNGYSQTTGVEVSKIKKLLKLKLKARGIDHKSLADMSENDLAMSIYVLNTELNPSRFDYSEYLK